MLFYKCRTKNDPENGTYGDCVSACVASVLDLDYPGEVPNFWNYPNSEANAERGMLAMDRYLATHGLASFFIPFGGQEPLAAVFQHMLFTNPGVTYLLFCASGTPDADHCVVCHEDKIIHDPAWIVMNDKYPNTNGYWTVCVFISGKMKP